MSSWYRREVFPPTSTSLSTSPAGSSSWNGTRPFQIIWKRGSWASRSCSVSFTTEERGFALSSGFFTSGPRGMSAKYLAISCFAVAGSKSPTSTSEALFGP